MPYTTVVPGTTITASWSNANVRDQTITPFASSLARDSAITSPIDGMLEYLQDVKRYTTYNGASWAPLGGQIIAWANRVTSSSTTTSEVGVLRVDNISLVAGTQYLIMTSPLSVTSSVSGDNPAAKLRYDNTGAAATTSSPTMASLVGYQGSFSPVVLPLVAKYIPGTNQTISLILTAVRFAGTGSVSISVTGSVPEIDLMVVSLGKAPANGGTNL